MNWDRKYRRIGIHHMLSGMYSEFLSAIQAGQLDRAEQLHKRIVTWLIFIVIEDEEEQEAA